MFRKVNQGFNLTGFNTERAINDNSGLKTVVGTALQGSPRREPVNAHAIKSH